MFSPYCRRIEIAGSIRRYMDSDTERWFHTVHDVELVTIPAFDRIAIDQDLFGQVAYEETDLLDEFVRGTPSLIPRLDKNGRSAMGPRYKRLLTGGFPLDLFAIHPPAEFGVVFAIRTGPAEFSKRLVTHRADGGYLPDEMLIREGALWISGAEQDELIPTPGESEFFDAIRLPWVEPSERR
jgi:DNA polymerase/3'-5' exonuclease PolX